MSDYFCACTACTVGVLRAPLIVRPVICKAEQSLHFCFVRALTQQQLLLVVEWLSESANACATCTLSSAEGGVAGLG